MRKALRRRAIALIAGLGVVLWTDGGRAAEGVREWIEALQPPAVAPRDAGVATSATEAPPRPLAIAALVFEANGTEMTADTRAELDHLASALMAPQFEGYVFEIRWYADPKKAGPADQALSERRAAAMYTYLQTRRGILPTRVMLRWGRRKPIEMREDVPANTLIIKVVNLGRE